MDLISAITLVLCLFSQLSTCLPPPTKSLFIENEGQSFWNKNAKKDIKRMLKAQALNFNVAKNVIILVGDGMGVNTVAVARIFKSQKNGDLYGEGTVLSWEEMPFSGLSKTYNTNHQVPDSAGTATAIFSGVKTRMGYLGVDHRPAYNECDTQLYEDSKLKGVLHWAQDAGKETGIVTTARITHATPGATYSHVTNRDYEADSNFPRNKRGSCQDIAQQLINSEAGKKLKVAFGGGRRNFLTKDDGGVRLDENLVEKARKMRRDNGENFSYLQTTADLLKWEKDNTKDSALGLFSNSHMSYEVDRDRSNAGQPSLSHMTKAAIGRLARADQGFFLMVESGRIDHAHHDCNAYRALDEAVEFDKTVKEIMENPLINLDETLIIVTADHSHAMTFNGYPRRGNPILGNVYTTNNGYPIHDLYKDGTSRAYSTISYANGPGFYEHFTGDKNFPWKDVRTLDTENVDYRQPAMTPGDDSETHGGEDVPIYAMGPMAHLLTGVHEQNYIAHVMAFASCYGPFRYDCDRGQATKTSTSYRTQPNSAFSLSAVPVITFASALFLLRSNF